MLGWLMERIQVPSGKLLGMADSCIHFSGTTDSTFVTEDASWVKKIVIFYEEYLV